MERREEWWMLAVPLELAVMARMGLHYPTVAELEANGWQDPRPLPHPAIVREELATLDEQEQRERFGGYCDPDRD